MPIGIILDIARGLIKRTSQPSSLAAMTALLAIFFSQESASIISENLQYVIIGIVGLAAIFKTDKSND